MVSDTGEDIAEANLNSDDESYKEMEIEDEMFNIANEATIPHSATAVIGGANSQPKLETKKIQSEIQQKPGIWRCPYCSVGFSEPEQYVLHEVTEHGENQKSNDGNVYQCTRCPCSFKTKNIMVDHFLQVHFKLKPKILVSPQKIRPLYSDPRNLRGHLNPQNKLKNAHKCDACSITFDDSTKFFYHMLQVHGRVFRIRKTEETNEDEHENQYVCPERTCSFRGCTKLQLLEHIKQHLDQMLPITKAYSLKKTSANIDLHLKSENYKVPTVSLENLSREVIPTDDVGTGECDLEQSFGACPKITATFSLADIVSPSPTFPATSSSSTSSSSITSFVNTTREMIHPHQQSTSRCSDGLPGCLNGYHAGSQIDKETQHLYSNPLNHPEDHQRNLTQNKGNTKPLEIFTCDVCKEILSCQSELTGHMKHEHQKRIAFECKLCLKKILHRYRFKLHMSNLHGKVFPNNEELMREANVSISYLCANEVGNLNSERKAGSINCTTIPIQNATKGRTEQVDLNERDMPLKSHQCLVPGCARKFKYFSCLKSHQMKHDRVFPFHCGWKGCTWRFTCKWELTQHYKRHTKEKPFGCRICPSSFARNYDLVIHMRIHKLPMTGIGANVHQN
ncbi:unnamed protein product [Orchesella dallaii]|uniref:C2H2-type domain-containing protein n=1 Tax=Orchesella dallaii TaxID=48710 RepID=A0ABP1QYW0_9HEXA